MGLAAYINHYVSVSGVAPHSNASHELKNLFAILRHQIEYDQLEVTNLAASELVARRVVQIQKAIRRSPKHPDFTGLDQLMASQLDETGGVVTSKFDEWVAQEQKTQAIIKKNTRLLQEEKESDAKRLANPKAQGKAGAKGDHEK